MDQLREISQKFIKLFFNEGETICVSPNKYGYHSISQESLSGDIPLISPSDKVPDSTMREEDIVQMCLNPVSGFKRDENVTAYRSFLIEIDDIPLKDQWEYVNSMGMPFSTCVFSGNKSLHFGIVLDKDLGTADDYRFIAKWILSIMDKADQQTGVPTRAIRFPENIRNDKGNKVQKLFKLNGRISKEDLYIWLNKYPEKKPVNVYEKEDREIRDSAITYPIPSWLAYELKHGLDMSQGGRNKKWFQVGREFSKSNLDCGEAIEFLSQYFEEEHDFRRREWEDTIRSAYRNKRNL